MILSDVGDNEIGENGAKALSNCIKNQSQLAMLLIGHNKIGVKGGSYIEGGISCMNQNNLMYLDLHNNNLNGKACLSILKCIKNVHKFKTIDLKLNVVTTAEKEEIEKYYIGDVKATGDSISALEI